MLSRTFLRSRIARLESKSEQDITYDEFIRFIHNKNMMDEKEVRRITSSRRYQEIMDDIRYKND